jgi:muramoyltetrapeptide carboxypeptidase
LIAAHCGTPWQIDARGALLALEDVGEPAYRIDRLLVQLRQAGVFDGVAGVLLGTFSGITTEDDSYGVDDVVRELVSDLAVPVLARLPFGHTAENAAFAIGGRARIQGSSVIFG